MLVIVLNDLIEKRSEGCVGVVGSSIHTNSGVSVLGSGEDALLEGNSMLIFLILELIPHLSGQVFLKERFCALGELGEVHQVLWGLQV